MIKIMTFMIGVLLSMTPAMAENWQFFSQTQSKNGESILQLDKDSVTIMPSDGDEYFVFARVKMIDQQKKELDASAAVSIKECNGIEGPLYLVPDGETIPIKNPDGGHLKWTQNGHNVGDGLGRFLCKYAEEHFIQ